MAKLEAVCTLLLLILLSADISSAKKKHHATPTYFGRLNPDGSLADAQIRIKFRKPIVKDFDERAALQVKPNYINSGDTVEVVWSGVTNATKDDIIALFCPKLDMADHYLDFINVTTCPTWTKGFGNQSVALFNMRSTCEFRYYRDKKNWVAGSNEIAFKHALEVPLQGHLSLTGDPTQMRVMWVSGTAEKPIVLYGQDSSVSLLASGSTRTYNASYMCGPPASTIGYWDPGYIHDVLLTGLKPNTKYYYTYGSYKMLTSTKRTFTTAPVPGPDVSFKFIVYGDMGLSPSAHLIADEMLIEAKNGSRFIFHNGDLSYARGYAYIWDQWHHILEPFATLIPYMVGVGNHEQDHTTGGEKDPSKAPGEGFHPWWAGPTEYANDSMGECGVPTYYRFHMPDNGNAVFWYSYDYGSVHLIMMSTEHNFTKGSPQYTWLENDLRNVDRSVTPWVVIGGHRPMYTSQEIFTDYVVSIGMQHAFEDLLFKYKVDMAYWAHYHSYERTCPVYKQSCMEGAPIHIVVGTAGKGLDKEPYLKMDWSEFRMNDWGYGRVTVHDHAHLLWEWIRMSDKKVVDSVMVEK